VNYALDLVANAHRQDTDAWIVTLNFIHSQIGHAFVAFPTPNMGPVYIEPQLDYAYSNIEIGKPLCLAVDTGVCEYDWGNVIAIHQPVQCNATTTQCWLEDQ